MDEAEIERQFLSEQQNFTISEQSYADDLSMLRMALVNEKAAPEILEFESDIIERLTVVLRKRKGDLQDKKENVKNPKTMFRLRLLQMELERINYLIVEYLRTRLHKIQTHADYILDHDEYLTKMSVAETTYARDYLQLRQEHMSRLCLSKLPSSCAQLNEPEMINEPNMNAYVFCKVERDLGSVLMDEDSEAIMSHGDLFAIRYDPIRQYVATGDITLI